MRIAALQMQAVAGRVEANLARIETAMRDIELRNAIRNCRLQWRVAIAGGLRLRAGGIRSDLLRP